MTKGHVLLPGDTDLSTIEAARTAGVSVRQLNHWAACGYLHPRREPGVGHRGTYLAWSVGEVDRAETLGILSRALNKQNLFALLAQAIEHGTSLVIRDGDYDVVVSWRVTKEDSTNGTNDSSTEPATA